MRKLIMATVMTLVMAVAFAKDGEIVKVKGRGIGTDKTEALKDAYRDAVERAVGLYVDAEQMMENEELVKDKILTQSNAYIEKYKIAKESKSDNGLITVIIVADVRKRALARKVCGIMPSSTVDLADVSKDLHAQIITDFKANDDALSIIKNELKDLHPVKQLMKVTLVTAKPVVEPVKEDASLVRLWYPVNVKVDWDKYYKEFAPRINRIFDQIKVAPAKRIDLKNDLAIVKAYRDNLAKEYGTTRKNRSGIMTCCDVPREIGVFGCGNDNLKTWGVALNEEYNGMAFFHSQIGGKEYILYGTCGLNGLKPATNYEMDRELESKFGLEIWHGQGCLTYYFMQSTYYHPDNFEMPEDCIFHVGVILKPNGQTLSGKIYKLPYDCVKEIVAWQRKTVGGEVDYANVPSVSYEVVFADSNGEEVAGSSFSLRNCDVLNIGCVLLENPKGDKTGGVRLWLVSPLVGGFAKSYVKWISVDVPKDDIAKIAKVALSLSE